MANSCWVILSHRKAEKYSRDALQHELWSRVAIHSNMRNTDDVYIDSAILVDTVSAAVHRVALIVTTKKEHRNSIKMKKSYPQRVRPIKPRFKKMKRH